MSKLVENYLLQEPIGKGVYGQVYRAIHQKSKLQYAVKVIPKSSFKSNPKLQQLAINEINILSSLKNQNIVRFIETLKTPNNFYFVYEYCNGGTLQSLMQKKKMLKENEALLIFRQLLDAFKQLNKNSIMHRDLKPDNIFFSEGKVKLGDFGFCKMLEVNMAQTMLGSPIYMAPEILREEIYTLKADIWSLGVVLFEMLFGYCPFESNSISQLINVLKETELIIPKDKNPISQNTETLIQKMLIKDQFKRIEWVDLFDFKIDDEGKIVSGYKKDMGIQALQKYFLFDLKGNSAQKQEAISNNIYLSNKDIKDEPKTKEKEKQSESADVFLKKAYSQQPTITMFNPIPPPSQHETKTQYKAEPKLQVKKESQISSPQYIPHKPSQQSFGSKHDKWISGITLLQQLSEFSTPSDQILIHQLLLALIKQINDEYQHHPEWTDVLMQEKKCLVDAVRNLGKDENEVYGKVEVSKIWKRANQSNRKIWERTIKFIYNADNDVESILNC